MSLHCDHSCGCVDELRAEVERLTRERDAATESAQINLARGDAYYERMANLRSRVLALAKEWDADSDADAYANCSDVVDGHARALRKAVEGGKP